MAQPEAEPEISAIPCPFLSCFGARDINFRGQFCLLRKVGDTVRQNLGKSERHSDMRDILALAIPEFTNLQTSQQRRMARQYAERAIRTRHLEFVDLLTNDRMVRSHDFEGQMIRQRHSKTRRVYCASGS